MASLSGRGFWGASIVGCAVFLAAPGASAECARAYPWSRLPESGAAYVKPLPIGLTVAAFVVPLAMAPTGADHELRVLNQTELGGSPNLEPVTVWTPYVVPAAVLLVDVAALSFDDCELAAPASAVLQSFVITLGTVTLLKWATGRAWPNNGGDPSSPTRLSHPEYATVTYPFSWDEGTAWPSGHTATLMAMAAALGAATEHRAWWSYAGYGVTGIVAAGMWWGDHHWASDIVSGGLLGFAIGQSVGTAFRPAPTPSGFSYTFVPWLDGRTTGLQVSGSF